jgi:protein involved in polysaccharide export with SLBB domain
MQAMVRARIAVAVVLLASTVELGVSVGVCESPAQGKKTPAASPYIIESPDILRIHVSDKLLPAARTVAGEHLVRPDGTIGLGTFGAAYVAGLTAEQVRTAVARNLKAGGVAKHLDTEEVARELKVEMVGYNSKFYYVVTDLPGQEQQVQRFSCHGDETVLEALAQIAGLPKVASRCSILVARLVGPDNLCQVFPVDWKGITQRGEAATNYTLVAGDRIYVREREKWAFEGGYAKVDIRDEKASQLLRVAFGDSSEALKAAIKVEVHSLGLVLAGDTFTIEADGRARFAPCWLARFSDTGDGPQAVVAVRCAEAWVTFDGPVRTVADIGRRRITEVEAGEVRMTFPLTVNAKR